MEEIANNIIKQNYNPSTPKVAWSVDDFDELNNSNGSVVLNDDGKSREYAPNFLNAKFGNNSERAAAQYILQSRKHHRNIALETGRKGEK